MSYQLKIDPKSRKAAKFISQLQKKIQAELIASGMTQQEVAELLGVDRSVVNRRLKGGANLTARSIAEFAYAFDKDVNLNFVDKSRQKQTNATQATDTENVIKFRGVSEGAPSGNSVYGSVIRLESAVS